MNRSSKKIRAKRAAPDQTRPSLRARFWTAMFAPVDIAALVYFRIVFGAITLWEAYRYYDHGWISRYYIEPEFYFKYYGMEWVQPWSGSWMYVHFLVLGLLAACIMLGLFYRVTSVLFFFAIAFVFLLDQTNYLNHLYLVCLIAFILMFLPAHRAASLDAGRRTEIRSNTVPAWTVWLLRLQVGVPYFYGGLAKLNSDWLQCYLVLF